jgi:hypothetical protein
MAVSARKAVIIGAIVAGSLAIGAAAFAQGNGNSGGTRPGWGFGDKNHTHTGPPGQSVKP